LFISREWRHLTNERVVIQQKNRNSWFRPSGTIKKVRARFRIWLPLSKYVMEQTMRGRIILPAMKLSRFSHHTTSYTLKNSPGELFTYTPVAGSCNASCGLSAFHSRTQIMRYAEQRMPTLNEYCVVCDERHVFQSSPMLKPAVCTRELCVFSFHTLGVMSGATEEVATGAEVIDLLVAMCRAALQSSRKSIIFEPYPSVVDPHNPKALAFSPKRKSYERLEKALDSILLIRRMAQVTRLTIKIRTCETIFTI
uniref:Poly (ADP-ribose) polymerase family, member 6b n=1 Tax=Echeneis naucrates TaxID=173247 RepID=A0A665TWX7_ECHNA